MMECAHCLQAAEARSMIRCPGCQGMICPECAKEAACPEATYTEEK